MRNALWVYLSSSPLLWLTGTLLVWLICQKVTMIARGNALAKPVLTSVVLIVSILTIFGIEYKTYLAGAQFIHFLLGPATVALGIPLYEHFRLVKENFIPVVIALVVGCITAVTSVIFLGRYFEFSSTIIASLAPKSTTAPVAMAITASLGGDPALTAALVIMTGIGGAVIVTPLMNMLRIRDYSARGFAAGLASHGIGTARAYAVDPVAGLFAGLAMALNAIVTSLIVHIFL